MNCSQNILLIIILSHFSIVRLVLLRGAANTSDSKIANHEYFLSGDQTFFKFTLCGTNHQLYEGNPATGNNFSVDAVEVLDWDSEGNVKGGKIFYNRLTALQQIVLAPLFNNTVMLTKR